MEKESRGIQLNRPLSRLILANLSRPARDLFFAVSDVAIGLPPDESSCFRPSTTFSTKFGSFPAFPRVCFSPSILAAVELPAADVPTDFGEWLEPSEIRFDIRCDTSTLPNTSGPDFVGLPIWIPDKPRGRPMGLPLDGSCEAL